MSIFNRKSNSPAPQPKPATPAAASRNPTPSQRPKASAQSKTHIARESKVTGDVTGDSELLIDGVVEGTIQLDSLVEVGPEGKVIGTIRAVAVRVGGKVIGNVEGEEKVQILASGTVEGDIVAPSVPIAEGAFFKGKVDMRNPPKSGGAQKAKTAGGGDAKKAAPKQGSGGGGQKKAPAANAQSSGTKK